MEREREGGREIRGGMQRDADEQRYEERGVENWWKWRKVKQ